MRTQIYFDKWIEFNNDSTFKKTPLHYAVYYHLILLSIGKSRTFIININEVTKQLGCNNLYDVLNCIFDLKEWMFIATFLVDKTNYKSIKITLL